MNLINKKIDERNEKIVRGLLKLPPNRRCINCDSLGPQYVCTNFWTFVCTTCSGIHREFTHRVKSISMSKFTTQEVEALQNGGNQRARELYLKGWDFHRQRLPSSSNVDKIREFMKNAYVDKKYIAGKVSDTPTDSQSPKSHDEHRRASSYHSYSQSPPYDHQYEERKYGKRAAVLTRKPGSERCLHIEKVSSFGSSPTHMSDKANDGRYTNEGSISRHSLHSESSGGDPFRPEIMSPSFSSNHSFSSPSAQDSMEWKTSTLMEEEAKREVNKVPRPQRTVSTGGFGSNDRNSTSSYLFDSNSQVPKAPEHDPTVVGHHSSTLAVPYVEKQSSIESSSTLDLFADQVVSQSVASFTVDYFQLPTTPVSQAFTFDTSLTPNPFQSSKTPPSVDFFGNNSQDLLHHTNLDQASSEITIVKNEGWAIFDSVPVESSLRVPITEELHKSDNGIKGKSFSVSPLSEKTHYEPLQSENQTQVHNAVAGLYPPLSSPWTNTMHHQAGASISQVPWSAFDDPMGNRHTEWEGISKKVEPHFAMSLSPADCNQLMNSTVTEDFKGEVTDGFISENGHPFSSHYQHTSSEINPDHQPYTTKYINPFDLPFDSDSDTNKGFLNMSSLETALSSDSIPTAFPEEFGDPWLSHYPVATLPTSAIQASIPSYVAGQSLTSHFHFTDVSSHNTLASIGRNPFA